MLDPPTGVTPEEGQDRIPPNNAPYFPSPTSVRLSKPGIHTYLGRRCLLLVLIVRLVLALVLLTPLVVAPLVITPLVSSVAPSPPAGVGERNETGAADGVGKQTANRQTTCQFQ